MVLRGTVRDGVIIPESGTQLANGTEVQIEVMPPRNPTTAEIPTLYDRVKDFIGIADRLPSDMAENHDHYVHGRPKNS
jgi:hypothetical protein